MGSRFCTPCAKRHTHPVHPTTNDLEPTTQVLSTPQRPTPSPVREQSDHGQQSVKVIKYAGFSFSLPKPLGDKFLKTADTDSVTVRPSTQRNYISKQGTVFKSSKLQESQDSLETINSHKLDLLKSDTVMRRNQELRSAKPVSLFLQESMGQIKEYPSSRRASKGEESPNKSKPSHKVYNRSFGEEVSFTSHGLSTDTMRRIQSRKMTRKIFTLKPSFQSSLSSEKILSGGDLLPPQNPKKQVKNLDTGSTFKTQNSEMFELHHKPQSPPSSLISLSDSPASRFSSEFVPGRKLSIEEDKERLTEIRELASVDTNSIERSSRNLEIDIVGASDHSSKRDQIQNLLEFKSKSQTNLYSLQLIPHQEQARKSQQSISPESPEDTQMKRVIQVKLSSEKSKGGNSIELKLPLPPQEDKTQQEQQFLRIPLSDQASGHVSSQAPISGQIKDESKNSQRLFSCELSPLNVNSQVYDDFTKRMVLANMNANLFLSNSVTTLSQGSDRRAYQTPHNSRLPPRSPFSQMGTGSVHLQPRYTLSRFSALHDSQKDLERNKMTPSGTQSIGQYSFHSIKSDELEARTTVNKKKKLRKIINQYVVLSTLKREGNQKVKQVLNRKDHKIYAMRVLQSAHKNHNTVRYIANLMSLKHPNLLNFVEAIKSSTGQKLYIVTELPTGKTVQYLLSQQWKLDTSFKGLPIHKCHSYFIQLIQGIEYCHNNAAIPISNLDIKACNLHLDKEQETLKLAFFSQRKVSHNQNSMVYNPYTAPQIIEGFPPDKASDIWATGIILYRMVTGSYPFQGETSEALHRAITQQEAEYPDSIKPMLANLLRKLLQKDRGKRITMEEIIEHDWLTSNGLRPLKAEFRHKGSRIATELSYPFSRLKVKGRVEMTIKRNGSFKSKSQD